MRRTEPFDGFAISEGNIFFPKMANLYYLRGPVNSGDNVFLTAIDTNNFLYFLTTDIVANQPTLVFSPLETSNPVEIGLGRSGTLINMATGGSFIGVNSANQAVLTPTITNFTATTTEVANYGLALVGATYTLSVNSVATSWPAWIPDPASVGGDGSPSKVLMTGNTPQLQYLSLVRFVPAQWYQAGNCNQVSEAQNSVLVEQNWWYSKQATYQGFTLVPDCQAGLFYNYCQVNTSCASNCKGPCSDPADVCLLDAGTFACGVPPVVVPFYKRWWFIALVATMIFLILLGFFLLIRTTEKAQLAREGKMGI